MYKGKTVAVVVPAHNEEKLIGRVIETMPDFVDRIIVVDDKSSDGTAARAESYRAQMGERLTVLRHEKNQGVGGAIATGYKFARDNNIDCTAVMAGDAQMDPADLPALLDPVASGAVDYSKGNRLLTGEAWKIIPKKRYLGNAALSLFTKIASGYWHVMDSQTGYTVIGLKALKILDIDGIYKRYGMPNDLLIKLNVCNCKVRDVSIKPVYNVGEKSGIRIWKVLFTISWLLFRKFFWRLQEKYIIRDFHPLVFFYLLGLILLPAGLLFGGYLFVERLRGISIAGTSALFAAFLVITGLQTLFFAMWFDMDYNKELK